MENWDKHIIQSLRGENSPEEARALQEWLSDSPSNQQYYDDLVSIWKNTEPAEEDFTPDIARALSNIHRKINEEPQKTVSFALWQPWMKWAAVILLGVALPAVIVYKLSVGTDMIVVNTDQETKEITLPDGSRIWLNAQSRISYLGEFTKDARQVALEGEAYFEVVPSTIPFIVQASGCTTRVVGTAFNIRSFKHENQTQLTVTSGKVLFYEQHDTVMVTKGEYAILYKSTQQIQKSEQPDDNALSWRTGKLIFKNASFEKVGTDLSHYYRMNIQLQGNSDNCSLTTSFDNQSWEEVLEELKILLNSPSIEEKNGMITIRTNSC